MGMALVVSASMLWVGRREAETLPPEFKTLSLQHKTLGSSLAIPRVGPAVEVPPVTHSGSSSIGRWVDHVGSAPDLKRVFDDQISTGDPRQRRLAARAFEACVPAFLGGVGEAPSAEPLIRALPSALRGEREVAYRELYARCHRLLAEDRTSLMQWQRELQGEPGLQEPGLRAQAELAAGNFAGVDGLVAEAMASDDPAAVMSLSGLATRLALAHQSDVSDPVLLRRARTVDAALPMVACDLGLDCSAQSLLALQLCAVQGACEGDVSARLMDQLWPETVDPAAVQAQRVRLLVLIRGGRPLGSADLLP